jgi:hypothetical protein
MTAFYIDKSVLENGNLHKEIIQWACSCLKSLGYTLKSNLPENMLNTPWSYVARFATSDGYIYLKHTPELIALEASIIQNLHDKFHAAVPTVIAHNPKLNCFLMKDAGRSLREILKKQFDVALFCKAIDQFTSLQITLIDHVDILLDIGVPDWRLDKLTDLYKHLLTQKDILIEDGLSEIEIIELGTLLPKLSNLCKKLSAYPIKPTIVQPDFSDNNTLIDDISQSITIIDLGEIVISHPFFSLVNCLRQVTKHYRFTEKDDMHLQIRDAYLKNYLNFSSKKSLLNAFATARILWVVYEVLNQHRLMLACGKDKIMAFQPGRLSNSLKEFMAACNSINLHGFFF